MKSKFVKIKQIMNKSSLVMEWMKMTGSVESMKIMMEKRGKMEAAGKKKRESEAQTVSCVPNGDVQYLLWFSVDSAESGQAPTVAKHGLSNIFRWPATRLLRSNDRLPAAFYSNIVIHVGGRFRIWISLKYFV